MTEKQMLALRKVIEYLDEERKDYHASGRPEGHVYESVMVLEELLDREERLELFIARKKY